MTDQIEEAIYGFGGKLNGVVSSPFRKEILGHKQRV